MVAAFVLHQRDRSTESVEVGLGERWQHLHQGDAAEPLGTRGGERRQATEGLDLGVAVQPGGDLVVEQQHAPGLGDVETGDDGCDTLAGVAAIDQKTALPETGDTDAGAGAATGGAGEFGVAGIATEQPAQGTRHRERQLRTGTKTDVRRHRLGDVKVTAGHHTEVLRGADDVALRALGGDAGDAQVGRLRRGHRSAWMLEREAEATEAPAETTVEVEKTHVQSRRGTHRDTAGAGGLGQGRCGARQDLWAVGHGFAADSDGADFSDEVDYASRPALPRRRLPAAQMLNSAQRDGTLGAVPVGSDCGDAPPCRVGVVTFPPDRDHPDPNTPLRAPPAMSHHPPESRHDVPCGFCGLLCDDLSLTIDHGRIRIDAGRCPRAAAGFAAADRALEAAAGPRVKGRPASLEQAIAAAAGVLRDAHAPLFGGCGTHLPGMRGILELADACGGTVDHMNSYSMFRNLHVLQNSGWVVTSLSEVRNRADLLVCFGTDIASRLPRFYERCLWVDDTLFGLRAEEREVVMLGAPKDAALATSPGGRPPQVLSCANEDLAEVAQALRALVRGAPVRGDAVAGIPLAELARLAERLKAARYGVVAWVSSDLDFDHAELAVQSACDLVRELNAHTRCNGLPLGGSDGDYTAHQVITWQTGFTVRTRLSGAGPQHDPQRFEGGRLLAEGAADALVWVSSFDPGKTPPASAVPSVVLGHPAMQVECQVFIPVGVPGIDAAGHLFRTDSSVAVPMRQLRDLGLPDVADVTTAILSALKPQRAASKQEARAC